MQRLSIRNFLTIKEAEIVISQFVVIIGPQASGKSVMAKLIYYIKDGCFSSLIEAIKDEKSYLQYLKLLKERFFEIFPEYTWKSQPFSIVFECGLHHVKILHQKVNNKLKLTFSYSDDFKRFYVSASKKYAQSLKSDQEEKAAGTKSVRRTHPRELLYKAIKSSFAEFGGDDGVLEQGLFIPAGRSFFAVLKQNVFAFLSHNIQIDPFLKEFGEAFESARNVYQYRNNFLKHESSHLDALISEILCGKYSYTKDDDWIVTNARKVKLVNSSSGQQEVLPMLLVLSFFPFVENMSSHSTFYIEEPEAHLFPHAQKKTIELIGLTHNLCKKRNNFLITTHSPYVLSSMNNLMAVSKAVELGKSSPVINRLKDRAISFEEVSAYAVKDGLYKSILDEESGLIDASFIDSVSNEVEIEIDEIMGEIYGA